MLEKIRDARTDALFEAVLSLKDMDECYKFFDDLCTVAEIVAMTQRFAVTELLDKGHIFTEIAEMTGASSATISRVKKCLEYGSDGYRAVLDRKKG